MLKNLIWVVAAVALASVVACTLDNPERPELTGPSEFGTAIEVRAVPDQLVSDGFSSSVIEAVVRGPNSERLSGRTINFDITTSGAGFLDLGNLAPLNGARPRAGGVEAGPVAAVSDGDGVARVRYWAPFRTDQENDAIVTITARESSTNFREALTALATADIFLRAANRPSFPGSNVCGFIIEPNKPTYDVGEPIAFTASQLFGNDGSGCAGNEIARYEWNISPNTFRAGRDIVHAFSTSGVFTVELVTTEAITGCQDICSAAITVVP
jgi:hypothetical protein